ncbi:MAG: GDCCVxC domain-containing (seleno)protein [Pseudohongiellaceae bacterium]
MQLVSVIRCPKCEFKKEETMPLKSCQWYYECNNCRAILRPQKGDCCVFCSFGTVPCPPVQDNGKTTC